MHHDAAKEQQIERYQFFNELLNVEHKIMEY